MSASLPGDRPNPITSPAAAVLLWVAALAVVLALMAAATPTPPADIPAEWHTYHQGATTP